ncbi:hypothetical protein CC86DRAFT_366563 [Ophiobolus disseminans]|uniref:Uncharacterized protein n=1 Tax=Ophiobolus disseminans TaxID=1469910 RepID=A0A6A7AEE8_9PLEO|nr:hypothetical protein CC86DRAFT_366563 [Ophiobolus disseminans]
MEVPQPEPVTKTTEESCYLLELPAGTFMFYFEPHGICADVLKQSSAIGSITTRQSFSAGIISIHSSGPVIVEMRLTQVCKQLRSEYRPLWLRASKPRIRLDALDRYCSAFFPSREDLQHAPDCLQISWYHNEDDETGEIFDITPLLKMHAYCPRFRCEVVSHKFAEGIFPTSDWWDGDGKEWEEECTEEMLYMELLGKFLGHRAEAWHTEFGR